MPACKKTMFTLDTFFNPPNESRRRLLLLKQATLFFCHVIADACQKSLRMQKIFFLFFLLRDYSRKRNFSFFPVTLYCDLIYVRGLAKKKVGLFFLLRTCLAACQSYVTTSWSSKQVSQSVSICMCEKKQQPCNIITTPLALVGRSEREKERKNEREREKEREKREKERKKESE